MYTGTLYPSFSAAEFSRRYAAVRAAMWEADLAALVLYGTVSSYNEVLYFSNFPVTREAMLVFPSEGEPTLFVQMFNPVQYETSTCDMMKPSTVVHIAQKGKSHLMANTSFRGEVRAPDFPSELDWINSDHPLHISELRGHIAIIHFWTFC